MRAAIFWLLTGCDAVFGLKSGVSAPTADAAHVCEGRTFGPGNPVAVTSPLTVENVRFDQTQTNALLGLSAAGDQATDIYQAAVVNGTIGATSKMAGISSGNYDSYASYAAPDQIVLASRRMNATDPIAIYLATAQQGSFDNAVTAPLFKASDIGRTSANEPYSLPTGVMYFTASADNNSDLFRSPSIVPFGAPVALDEINTTNRENAAVVSDDELEIFFASDRDDPSASGGLDGLDIYTAIRASADVPFGPATRVDAISTTNQIEYPVWISQDACELFYISKTAATPLYVTTR